MVNDEFNILRDKSFDMHEEEAPVHLSIRSMLGSLSLSLCRNAADKIISFQVSPREKDPLSLSKYVYRSKIAHCVGKACTLFSSGIGRFNFYDSFEMRHNSLHLFIYREKLRVKVFSRLIHLFRARGSPPSLNKLIRLIGKFEKNYSFALIDLPRVKPWRANRSMAICSLVLYNLDD